MKAIKIKDIAIDGGTQRTHENYVIGFSDGTAKVGTTGRGSKRVAEVVRQKLKEPGCEGVVSYFMSGLRTRDEAYRIERDTCFLIRSRAIAGTREWFRADAHYIEQTVKMFEGCGLNRGAA